ncbi:ATP-binding cassette domain-containing protein [Thiotrichales bacterium 19S9-12]|nr:ATP-binding cassette domain-containing protein [Thiotrichales bacterium 19S9-11]MCF6810861.1 ATP-binding cassette domain-containing protein [Thiotrichales bacterium 19S9-12]
MSHTLEINKQKPPILSIKDLKVHFPIKRNYPWQKKSFVKAVNGVSFDVYQGETIGLVGESGCGKSTLLRALIGLIAPISQGSILYNSQNLAAFKPTDANWQKIREDIQMIFQDPFASLNPRMTVGNIIAEPLRIHKPHLSKKERKERVIEMMQLVGLSTNFINRYPHQFSGGQCQRVGIARALIIKPKILLCDEPVSALDVSIQAQVVNLLKKLQEELKLTIIFVAHNLSVVKHISDKIVVMYLGKVMEVGNTNDLCDHPQHPYTKALLSAVPLPDPLLERNKKVQILEGDLPSPINPPSGCVFSTRCPMARDICQINIPPLKHAQNNLAACVRL